MPTAPLHRRAAPPLPSPADVAAFDALLARTARRLRHACRPMPAAALDALARTLVLDAMRVALRWAED